MPFKNKDKQKEATREAVRRHRARQQGITDEGITLQGITSGEYELGLTVHTAPDGLRQVYDPDGSLARIEDSIGRPLSYNRPLMPCEVR